MQKSHDRTAEEAEFAVNISDMVGFNKNCLEAFMVLRGSFFRTMICCAIHGAVTASSLYLE